MDQKNWCFVRFQGKSGLREVTPSFSNQLANEGIDLCFVRSMFRLTTSSTTDLLSLADFAPTRFAGSACVGSDWN
jgi:hypothetical protein